MSETETMGIETKQADREASGARPYGRYLEDFEVGAVYKHWPAKTVTEADDHLFCLLTMNHHPLHINDVYAAESQQGRNVVVGPLVYSLALGMSVADVSGKAIANLATEDLSHPAPVFHGDTLFAESEVLDVKESQSKPDRGVVRVHTRVHKQDGTLVAEFKRAVLVPRRVGRLAERRAGRSRSSSGSRRGARAPIPRRSGDRSWSREATGGWGSSSSRGRPGRCRGASRSRGRSARPRAGSRARRPGRGRGRSRCGAGDATGVQPRGSGGGWSGAARGRLARARG